VDPETERDQMMHSPGKLSFVLFNSVIRSYSSSLRGQVKCWLWGDGCHGALGDSHLESWTIGACTTCQGIISIFRGRE